MDCDSDCMERDILNEFETVDGMPVYYGGDCYALDWEDPRDLAYADWVDWYNFSAPEGYGVDLPDMEDIGLPKGVDATMMMVGEVASPGHERQELSSYSFPAADMVITELVADILIVGRDVPVVAVSPDHLNTFDPDLLNTFETVCGMPVYYGGDLNDSDCESVGDHDLDTWEDCCDSDLQNRYYGFPLDTEDAQPPIIFSAQVFRGEDMVEPSRVRPNFWNVSVSELQVISSSGDISAS